MKEIILISLVWLITILVGWGLFFYCRDKGDGYFMMGFLTGTIILGISIISTFYIYTGKINEKRKRSR